MAKTFALNNKGQKGCNKSTMA